jgi:hypothetical protein
MRIDVSEEHATSIIRVEKQAKQAASSVRLLARHASADFWQTNFVHKKTRNWIVPKCMPRNGKCRGGIITKRK